MKAVVLAGGKGTRLGIDKNKCAIKVFGIPLINYTLGICRKFYEEKVITETIVVVGDRAQDVIRINNASFNGMPLKYVRQIGDTAVSAIVSTFDHVNDRFMLFLGDEIYLGYDTNCMARKLDTEFDGIIGYVNAPEQDIRKTYTFKTKGDYISKIVEKPSLPFNDMMGTGNCILTRDFFKWAYKGMLKGISDFPTVINEGIKFYKAKITYCKVADGYFNINNMEEYNQAVEFLRDR